MNWNEPVHPIFRVLAGLLGMLFLYVARLIWVDKFTYNESFRGMIAMIGFGVIFLFIAVRGKFLR